jgi:ribosomal protein S19E (S16A)
MMVNDTHPPFLREGVVGKELEILKEIALWNKKKRCTQYRLRQSSQHWGIETIKKQIHRLDREGCIEKEKNGYTVTDRGLFTLLEYVVVERSGVIGSSPG